MATKINLLPPGFGVTGNLGKILKAVRMVCVIGLAFFLVFGLGISIYFIVSTITFNALKSETNSLKEQVKTLQTTEQQIVLLKDRVGKINTVLSFPEAIKNLDAIEPFISNLSSSASLNQLEIDAQKIDLSFQFSIAVNYCDNSFSCFWELWSRQSAEFEVSNLSDQTG